MTNNKKNSTIGLRVTNDFKNKVEAKAKENNMSVGSYITKLVNNTFDNSCNGNNNNPEMSRALVELSNMLNVGVFTPETEKAIINILDDIYRTIIEGQRR